MIHEYECRECGETFIGDGGQTERHYQQNSGNDCWGVGTHTGSWG